MNAQQTIAAAQQAGVQLMLSNGRVRYRAPEGAMTPELAEAVKTNRAEIVRMLARRAVRPSPTPARCIGPSVCAVIGVCGRMTCLSSDEALDWIDEIEAARSPLNPHRVPEFDSSEERKAA